MSKSLKRAWTVAHDFASSGIFSLGRSADELLISIGGGGLGIYRSPRDADGHALPNRGPRPLVPINVVDSGQDWLAYSPSERRLLATATTVAMTHRLDAHEDVITSEHSIRILTPAGIGAPAAAFALDGKRAALTSDTHVFVLDTEAGTVLWRAVFPGFNQELRSVTWLPISRPGLIVVGGFGGTVRLLSHKLATISHEVKQHAGTVWALCPLEGGRFLSGSEDGRIQEWQVSRQTSKHPFTMQPLRRFTAGAGVNALCQLPSGEIAVGMERGRIEFLNLDSGISVQKDGHTRTVSRLISVPSALGELISADLLTVVGWRHTAPSLPIGSACANDALKRLVPDGKGGAFFLTQSSLLGRCDLHTGCISAELVTDEKVLDELHYSATSNLLVAVGNGELRCYRGEDGTLLNQFVLGGHMPRLVALSADGERAQVQSTEHVTLYQLRSGTRLRHLAANDRQTFVYFGCPDGEHAIGIPYEEHEPRLSLYNLRTDEQKQAPLIDPPGDVNWVSFDRASGAGLFAAYPYGMMRVWWTQPTQLRCHPVARFRLGFDTRSLDVPRVWSRGECFVQLTYRQLELRALHNGEVVNSIAIPDAVPLGAKLLTLSGDTAFVVAGADLWALSLHDGSLLAQLHSEAWITHAAALPEAPGAVVVCDQLGHFRVFRS